jgi:hypothetical protein
VKEFGGVTADAGVANFFGLPGGAGEDMAGSTDSRKKNSTFLIANSK